MKPVRPRTEPQFLRLAVSGPTGSGKTTFAECLGRSMNAIVIPETVPADLLARFARRPATTSFQLQREIVRGRIRSFAKVADNPPFVLDRTVSEDRNVFFRLHHMLGLLSSQEVEELDAIAAEAEGVIGLPQAVVFLCARPEVLLFRMEHTNTPPILREALARQLALYEDWRVAISVPWVLVDTTDILLHDVPSFAKWVAETALVAISGGLPHNRALHLQWSNSL